MKSMIVLMAAALFGCAHASAWGYAPHWSGPPAHVQLSHDGKYLLDTPEVAHAKAAHLQAHAAASHGGLGDHGGWDGAWEGPAGGAIAHYGGGADGHYGAPGAGLHKYGPAPLAHDGRVIDTPEVAHLKAAHLQAHASAAHGILSHAGAAHGILGHAGALAGPAHYGGGYAEGHGRWHGPQAHIQLTHDGKYVVDTPEVQHARAAHYAAHAHAGAHAAASPEEPWGHEGYAGAGAGAWGAPAAFSHGGPYLADTPAVAHARAQHLAAKAAIVGHGAHGWA